MLLTLCPFMPGSPGVPGKPRAPCKGKEKDISERFFVCVLSILFLQI